MNRFTKYISIPLWPTLILVGVLLLAGLAHGYNMFRFPYFENDEGVYMSQAWSVITQGKLAPYTYWYDHAPMSWFVIAIWTKLTGGFYTFGYSVQSGRVLMLLFQLLNTFSVFYIAKRLTGKTWVALLSCIPFAISPLGIFYHRRVLLDNFMTTFILCSYAVALRKHLTLYTVWFSAFLLAIGILCKENGIFFIPGIFLLIAARSHKTNRILSLFSFVLIVGSIVSMYFLYANLNGELFPTGSLLGGKTEHVSLLGTLSYHASRKGTGIFDPKTWASDGMLLSWYNQDPVLVLGGVISCFLIALATLLKKKFILLSLPVMTFGILYFFIRGGVVYEFYIVPIVPFLALCLGTALGFLIERFGKRSIIIGIATIAVLGLLYKPYVMISRSFPRFNAGGNLYTTDQTRSQREALDWIRKNIKQEDALIFDNHFQVDLKDPNNPSGIYYPNAHWYWKVDLDPEIRDGVYQNNPDRIDYVAETPQMSEDLNAGASPLTKTAADAGMFYKAFDYNGWSVNIIRAASPRHVLDRSWEWYKSYFIAPDGRVVDRSDKGKSTSEGQSYAMLRAVWMDDKETFAKSWDWTKNNLLQPSGVFAWKWTMENQSNDPGNTGSAPDADTDIALALALASKRWNNDTYKQDAQKVIEAIWNQEVAVVAGKPYMLAGNWAKYAEVKTVNPSYFAPYAYRIFADITPKLAWNDVVDSSYELLTKCSASPLNKPGTINFLPPEWCALNYDGSVTTTNDPNSNSTEYSYNAFRVPFRIALDYQWNKDDRAKTYLEKLTFIREEWDKNKKLFATYSRDGKPTADYEATAAYAGDMGAFMLDSKQSQEFYRETLRKHFYEVNDQSFWDDPNNYYTQNWGWFGTALYGGKLVNWWVE